MGHKYESNSLFLRKSYTNSRKQCIRLIYERFCSLGNSGGMQSYIEGHSFNDHANELIANAGWTHLLNQLSRSTKCKTRRQHTRIKYTPLANLPFLPLVSGSVESHRSCIMLRASHTTDSVTEVSGIHRRNINTESEFWWKVQLDLNKRDCVLFGRRFEI